MRSLLFGASAIALMTPASAIAGEAYVGVSGGLVLPENSRNQGEFDTTVPAVVDGTTEVWGAIPAGTDLEWTTEFQEGWQAGGVIGYAFDNGLRAEIEGFYNEVDVDQHYDIAVGSANIGPADASLLLRALDPAGIAVGSVLADGRGDVKNYGAFLNLLYDFDADGPVSPYVGCGIGYQWTKLNYAPSGVAVGSVKDDGLAWQGIAGISFDVSSNVEMFAQYAYRAQFDDTVVPLSIVPATIEVKNKQSLLTAGLRVKFGTASASAPAAASASASAASASAASAGTGCA